MSDSHHWHDISRELAMAKPVFVIGIFRSGTTAFRGALGRLEAFRSTPNASPETKIFLQPGAANQILDAKDGRLLRYFADDREEAERLVSGLGAIARHVGPARRTAARLIARFGDRDSARAARWRLLGHHHVARLFFHHSLRARKTVRVLEKTPAHVRRLPEMFATFPNLRAIAMMRHPVEVYSSLRKRLVLSEEQGLPEERVRWMRMSPTRFIGRYAEVASHTELYLQERPDQLRLVRYEDLTSRPEEVLREVCEFIGEEADTAWLSDRAGRLTHSTKSWREWLDEETAGEIEEKLSDTMSTLGYEPLVVR